MQVGVCRLSSLLSKWAAWYLWCFKTFLVVSYQLEPVSSFSLPSGTIYNFKCLLSSHFVFWFVSRFSFSLLLFFPCVWILMSTYSNLNEKLIRKDAIHSSHFMYICLCICIFLTLKSYFTFQRANTRMMRECDIYVLYYSVCDIVLFGKDKHTDKEAYLGSEINEPM